MPKYRMLNDEEGAQQSYGKADRVTRKLVYAFEPKNPLVLHEFGGHPIPEAPEYVEQTAQPQNVMKTEGGINITVLKHVDEGYIQGEDLSMSLPEERLTLAHIILQVQKRSDKQFRWVLLPTEDCNTNCDQFAQLRGLSGRMDEIKETGAVVAFNFDGDSGSSSRQVMIKCEGATIDYHGVDVDLAVQSGGDPFYAALVGAKSECIDDFCPYQKQYFFDSAGSVTTPIANVTSDKHTSSSTIDTAAMTVAGLAVSAVWWRGDLYIAETDVFKATSTAGSVFKSVGGSAAFVDVGITSVGINALVVAGSRLHAFGTAGEWHYTSDGQNWTTVAGTPLGSGNLYTAVYNPKTKRIYVGGAAGVAYVIRNGTQATALATMGAGDLISSHWAGDDHIMFGDTVGQIYEHFSEAEDGGAFTPTQDFGTDPIHVLLGDHRSTNVLAGVGSGIWQRDIAHAQEWVQLGSVPSGTIYSGSQGYEEHRRGVDYFVFGTSAGDLVEVQNCAPCST